MRMHDFSHGDLFAMAESWTGYTLGPKRVWGFRTWMVSCPLSFLVSLLSGSSSTSSIEVSDSLFWFLFSQLLVFWCTVCTLWWTLLEFPSARSRLVLERGVLGGVLWCVSSAV